jgi:hypothetical protein
VALLVIQLNGTLVFTIAGTRVAGSLHDKICNFKKLKKRATVFERFYHQEKQIDACRYHLAHSLEDTDLNLTGYSWKIFRNRLGPEKSAKLLLSPEK